MRWPRYVWLALCVVMVGFVAVEPLIRLQAQNSTVIVTVAVPDMLRDALDPTLTADFEASHPGVQVNVVSNSDQTVPYVANGIDKHFEALQKYANTADVLYVDLNTLNSSAATRAGYFLDLAPLVDADRSLKPDDYYPALWRSFQWDQGLWALPVVADPTVLIYDPVAFDRAGLSYPDSKWTLDDLARAVRALAVRDTAGKVTTPGMAIFPQAEVYLFLSLLGEGLVDTSVIPNSPQIDRPALETMLDTWMKLQQEGLLGSDFQNAPLSIAPLFTLLASNMSDAHHVGTLLPGGKAGVNVTGFAVSGGTQYPAQAYELAKYLTTRPEMSRRLPSLPARKSLSSVPDNGPTPRLNVPPGVQQLEDAAIANALTLTDLRFGDYLLLAMKNMASNGVDARTALQAAEAEAIKAVQAADSKKGSLVFAVATPIPRVEPAKGKSTLNFGLTSFLMPLPSRDLWDRVLNDFAANDPQVGKVNLEIAPDQVDTSATKYDCFYLPYNAVPTADLTSLLNLDPFLAADSTFDKTDIISNVMAQLQRENKTWAMPIVIQPSLLAYNADKFSKANVPTPVNGWTISEFDDALKALKPDANSEPPFVPSGVDQMGGYLLNLIAAHGGLPLDYRTNPVTINFTDPATMDAIRQVLDLAKQGYIKYSKLGNKPFQPISIIMIGSVEDAIHSTDLTMAALRPRQGNEQPNPYRLTTYPKGTRFSALSFSIGTAYISAQSQNPEACYRLISALAKHPELFSSMPVRRSLINADVTAAVQGADLTALYNQIDALLKDPNTISLPSGFAGSSAARMVVEYWLYDAFDNYVLRDGDLESSLKDAETYAKGFQECMAKAAPSEPGQPDQPDAAKRCAETVDPHLKG